MSRTIASTFVCLLVAACGSSKSDEPLAASNASVSYYADVAPILQDHCLQCHQQGGIGEVRLDDYATAKKYAAAMASKTADREMPPWSITSDGSCGEFKGSLALSDEQIDTIGRWAKAGAPQGKEKAIEVPALPSIGASTPYLTPKFTPVIQGGPLTAADEYRCFELDSGVDAQKFITGYDVEPGNEGLIHHVLAFVIDPDAKTELRAEPNLTNQELMDRLHAETPDRDGWECFGMAGDGVSVSAAPVVWAPGQGPVQYPVKSGVPLKPTDKVVLQVHYNMSNMQLVGESDQTTVKLQLASEVERVGIFVLSDPFLNTLGDDKPAQLAPGKASEKYIWKRPLTDFGLEKMPDLQLNGVMPHMHQRGRKYQLQVSTAGDNACAADVQNWDFHWQRMYFYDAPPALDAHTTFNVTCDYDTSDASEPVLPGWGTSNEMCLATLYFTAPVSVLQ